MTDKLDGLIGEDVALAHAGPRGHVCGREPEMRAFAVAVLEQAAPSGAVEVFVTPQETFIEYEDHALRLLNSPKMVEAMDAYHLTGEFQLGEFELLPPKEGDELGQER